MNVENSVPNTVQPGKNGGRLRRGNPGNKGGGRLPDEYKAMCRAMVSSPKAQKAVEAILSNPDHPHFASMWKAVTERGYGKLEQKIDAVHRHYREAIEEVRQGLRLVG